MSNYYFKNLVINISSLSQIGQKKNEINQSINIQHHQGKLTEKDYERLLKNWTKTSQEWELVQEWEDESSCICLHSIKRNYQIKNKHTGNMAVVGSDCINQFRNKHLIDQYEILIGKHRCFHCYKNNTDETKNTVSKRIVDEQKEDGCEIFYHRMCLKKVFKKCRKCDKYKNYNCKCDNITNFFNNSPEPPPPYETTTPPPPETLITLDTIVKFGKYKGKQIFELIKDLSYCKWIKCEDDTYGQFKKIQEYLSNNT